MSQQHQSFVYIKNVNDGKRYKFVSKSEICNLTGARIDTFLKAGVGIKSKYRVTFCGVTLHAEDVLRDIGVEVGHTLLLEPLPSPPREEEEEEEQQHDHQQEEQQQQQQQQQQHDHHPETREPEQEDKRQEQHQPSAVSSAAAPAPAPAVPADDSPLLERNNANPATNHSNEDEDADAASASQTTGSVDAAAVAAAAAAAVVNNTNATSSSAATTAPTTTTTGNISSSSSSSPSKGVNPDGSTWVIVHNVSNGKKYKFVSRSDIQELNGQRVKQFLSVAAGVDEASQRLTYKGSEVGDDQRLRDVGVALGSNLEIEVLSASHQHQQHHHGSSPSTGASPGTSSHRTPEQQRRRSNSGGASASASTPGMSVTKLVSTPPSSVGGSSASRQQPQPQPHEHGSASKSTPGGAATGGGGSSLYIKNRQTGKSYKFVSQQDISKLTGARIMHFMSMAAHIDPADQTIRFNNLVVEPNDSLTSHGISGGDTLFVEVSQFVPKKFWYSKNDQGKGSSSLLVDDMIETMKTLKEELFEANCKELQAIVVRDYLPLAMDASDPLMKFRQSIGATSVLETVANLPLSDDDDDDDDDSEHVGDADDEDEHVVATQIVLEPGSEDPAVVASQLAYLQSINNSNKHNKQSTSPPSSASAAAAAGAQAQDHQTAQRASTTSSSQKSASYDALVYAQSTFMVIEERPSTTGSVGVLSPANGGSPHQQQQQQQQERAATSAATSETARSTTTAASGGDDDFESGFQRRRVERRMHRKLQKQRDIFCEMEAKRRGEFALQHYTVGLLRILSEFEDDIRGAILNEEDKKFYREISSEDAIIMSRLHKNQRVQRRVDAKNALDEHARAMEEELKQEYLKELEITRESDFAVRFRRACNKAHDLLKQETQLLFEAGKVNSFLHFGLDANGDSPPSSRQASAVGGQRSGGSGISEQQSVEESVARSEQEARGLSHRFGDVANFLD